MKRKVVSNKKYLRYRNLIIIDRSYICFFHVLFCMQDHVLEYNLYLVKKNKSINRFMLAYWEFINTKRWGTDHVHSFTYSFPSLLAKGFNLVLFSPRLKATRSLSLACKEGKSHDKLTRINSSQEHIMPRLHQEPSDKKVH